MQNRPQIVLHKHKADAVQRFHPWIFSGAIKNAPTDLKDGDIVDVVTEKGQFLATGHFAYGSIAVRVFSFEQADDITALWKQKFADAFQIRKVAGLTDSELTTCYRLINAEGDGMPGLIIDWYNGTAVIQAHSPGMYKEREKFVEILKELYGDRLKAVYDKSSASLHVKDNSEIKDGYICGKPETNLVSEHGHTLMVDWELGQKTGFFIDQRENRYLLGQYAKGKTVLNTFCYSGGFSVYAVKEGASHVDSVDGSAKAIEWTDKNVELNNEKKVSHASHVWDVFDFLKASDDKYDVIVLDPPAFAKGLKARHQAVQAYKRLNAMAFSKIKSGGVVFTFSCSQAVSPEFFAGAVTAAAIESRRDIKILHHLTQPADHPISIFHPEGLYLKGLVVYVK
jgi:23S rRNA (cytosine1962-C5)-methyltransferase